MTGTSMSTQQNGASIQASSASSAIGYQSWDLLEHEFSIDWGSDNASAPTIYIVSTIHALSESLFLSADTEAFVSRTSGFAGAPVQWHSTRSSVVPIFNDDTATVALCSRNHAADRDQHAALRLPVDLRTLLTSVLISPRAPAHFFDLVSNLVQRVSRARVSHANWSIMSDTVRTAQARRA